MVSLAQKLTAAAEATGLLFDSEQNVLHGTFHGYCFSTSPLPSNARYCYIYFHVTKNWNMLTADEGKEIAKQSNKLVEFFRPANGVVNSFLVKLGNDEATAAQKLTDALTYLADTFSALGFVNACAQCGQPVATEACAVGNGVRFLCPDCFETVSVDLGNQAQADAEKTENVGLGAIGALGGALIGAVTVVLFGRLGMVSALSGLIAAICALKGYELLAKKMSVKGVVVSCIAIVVMIYLGYQADWAIEVTQVFEVDFFTAFRSVPYLIHEGVIRPAAYLGNLFLLYLFAVLGSAPSILRIVKGQKNRFVIRKFN